MRSSFSRPAGRTPTEPVTFDVARNPDGLTLNEVADWIAKTVAAGTSGTALFLADVLSLHVETGELSAKRVYAVAASRPVWAKATATTGAEASRG